MDLNWYTIIQALSMVIWVVFYIFYGKHCNLSKPKSFLVALFSCIVTYFGIMILTWIETHRFGAQNAVRMFGFIILVLWAEKYIFNIDLRKNLDFQCLWPMLWFGLGHFACIYDGCCHSFQFTDGTLHKIAQALTGTDLLPQQLGESVCALLIFVVLAIVMKKKNYYVGGKMYFIMLIAYGAQRVLWEFFRDNNKLIVFSKMHGAVSVLNHDAVWGISNLAIWAASMVVEGIIGLIVLRLIDKKKAKKEIAAA